MSSPISSNCVKISLCCYFQQSAFFSCLRICCDGLFKVHWIVSPTLQKLPIEAERMEKFSIFNMKGCVYWMTWGSKWLNVQMIVWCLANMTVLAAKAGIHQSLNPGQWYFQSLATESIQSNNQTRNKRHIQAICLSILCVTKNIRKKLENTISIMKYIKVILFY